ncbi:MarR family winged helix-turn-helix transcriptional regulator [Synoicihabitans lomoniglobus]|uniref:MarR family winged helix-turn-helix transcriptional regulator n=1 Tax=Synoicihabitans lomoniglobus TaxID=2909285 RepID=A0AAF0CIR0_9BACT|nr:MarR family winged helix-turn-helix transcriptional regulator [Opitutaceae bacterium LMO-M01]WED65687.1 MarR family winged helix-turn-helix transcriptional regulator [Opitutaceae bacterium LMO-M01]
MKPTSAEIEARAPSIAQCRAAAAACVCFNIRRTARLVTHVYDEALAPVNVSSGQFVILLSMRILEMATMQQLAEAVALDRSALSRAIRPLVGRDLLQVDVGADRRRREVRLTTAGLAVLADGAPHWQRAQDRLLEGLGEQGFHGLLHTSIESYRQLSA